MRPCGWCRFFFRVAYGKCLFVWMKMIFFFCLFCSLVNLVINWWIRTDAPKCVKMGISAQKREGIEGEGKRCQLCFFRGGEGRRVDFGKFEGV